MTLTLRDTKIMADLAFRLRVQTDQGNYALTTSLLPLNWLLAPARPVLDALYYALWIMFAPVHVARLVTNHYPALQLATLTAVVLAWLYAAYLEFGIRQIFRV